MRRSPNPSLYYSSGTDFYFGSHAWCPAHYTALHPCIVLNAMPRPRHAHPPLRLSTRWRIRVCSPSVSPWHASSNLKPGFPFRVSDSDRKVNYGIVTLTSVWNCEPISVLASSLWFGRRLPKRMVACFSRICSRTNCDKSAFSFWSESGSSKTNSEYKLPLFDLGTKVPKRTVKKWAVANDNLFWTIGFLVSIWDESSKTNSGI